jgi:hypothetical protein
MNILPKPFNHPMHTANTIAKRQRELHDTLAVIEQLPKGSNKTKLRLRAYEIFEIAMTEVHTRLLSEVIKESS